jgi:hypothetical protein
MTERSEGEIREWARSHKACWEFEVVQEMIKGEGMRPSSAELRLYAQPGAGDKATERPMKALWERLREIALAVVAEEEGVRSNVAPFQGGARLRPETGQAAEAMLLVRFVPSSTSERPGRERVQAMITAIEARLKARGLVFKAWAA